MDNVENHKVKNTGANQHLIVVQDGFDAVQCREEVTNEQCCQVKQGVKQESEGHRRSPGKRAGVSAQ